MNYLLNKSAIERILRQTDSEPDQLLEWFEWAVESNTLIPCLIRPYLKKYNFYNVGDIEYSDIGAKNISTDFYSCHDFLEHCQKNSSYFKKVVKEYKKRFNL